MEKRELIEYCLTYPDAYEDYPFDEGIADEAAWTVIRHAGNKKSFAMIYDRNGLCVNLKCEPLRAEFFRQVYSWVTPGYHMNKVHWNTIRIGPDVDEAALKDMIGISYELTKPHNVRRN